MSATSLPLLQSDPADNIVGRYVYDLRNQIIGNGSVIPINPPSKIIASSSEFYVYSSEVGTSDSPGSNVYNPGDFTSPLTSFNVIPKSSVSSGNLQFILEPGRLIISNVGAGNPGQFFINPTPVPASTSTSSDTIMIVKVPGSGYSPMTEIYTMVNNFDVYQAGFPGITPNNVVLSETPAYAVISVDNNFNLAPAKSYTITKGVLQKYPCWSGVDADSPDEPVFLNWQQ